MAGNDTTKCRRDSNGAQLGGVVEVLVQAEKVGTCEIGYDRRMELPIINAGEEANKLFMEICIGRLGKSDKNIHTVHDYTGRFSFGCGFDCGYEVTTKLEKACGRLRGCSGGSEGRGMRCMQLSRVEFLDMGVESGLADGGDWCDGSGSSICTSVVIIVCCMLGCFVDGDRCRGSGWRG